MLLSSGCHGRTKQGNRRTGRLLITYVDRLRYDTGLTWMIEELEALMDDEEEWRHIVNNVRIRSNHTDDEYINLC